MVVLAVLCLALLVTAIAGPVGIGVAYGQSSGGGHDTDGDGLIEISNLEQLDAIRYDSDGDGKADEADHADAYAAVFPGTICGGSCQGYELARSLDFDDGDNYASGAVNSEWTSGDGWLPLFFSYFLLGSEVSFEAILDGNGHTISNLYIDRAADGAGEPVGMVGLFGAIGSSGEVRNLGLVDANVTGLTIVGGLVGLHLGSISDSYTTGRVSGAGYAGGLAGWTDVYSTISDSHSTAEVVGWETESESVGGLVGYHDGAIIFCYATGNVFGDTAVGGLTGSNYGGIIASYASGNSSGNVAVGGLAGHTNGFISGSYATGQVSGKYAVGGLAGQNNVTRIVANYATGSVSGDENVGGLVGLNNGRIIASYSTGYVSGNTSVGGLVGQNGMMHEVVTSYSTGQVSARGNTGGLIGENYGQATNSLWDIQTSGSDEGVGDGESAGVVGKTTAELQAPAGYTSIYAGWALDLDGDPSTGTDDFWDFGAPNEYPTLKAYWDYAGDVVDWWESGKQPRAARAAAPTPTPVVSPLLSVRYDSDEDGLIEVSNLEQLHAIRYDLDGDGLPADGFEGEYAAVYPISDGEAVCGNDCLGYELSRSLDFADGDSYASGETSASWTEGVGWLPIGQGRDYDGSFNATFDGNGHTVSNLYVNLAEGRAESAAGLFGYAGKTSIIRNIGIVHADVSGTDSVGGLVGWNEGVVEGSYATGIVEGDAEVGGLVGSNRAHTAIRDSYTTAVVSGEFNAGGLVGRNEGDISGSHATGNVSGGDLTGGLTGVNAGTIVGSYATGNVSGSQRMGGLVGGNSGANSGRGIGGVVRGSYAEGAVSGAYKVGGLVGSNSVGTIIVSYAIGSVDGSGNEVGGLAGSNNFGRIVASYATGSVNGGENVGGLAGESHHSDIVSSYAAGVVAGESSAGGLVGAESGSIRESASFWDTQTSGQATSAAGEGKTTAELQAPTGYSGIYSGWAGDLDNVDGDDDTSTGVDDFWDFGSSGQYPALKFDFDGDGKATWQEFGSQDRDALPAPVSENGTTPTPTATPERVPLPTLTPAPIEATATPEPVGTVGSEDVAATATPTAQTSPPAASSGGSCNIPNGNASAGSGAVSVLLLVAPLAIFGGLKYRRRRGQD